jgi:hypothetical protein
MEVFLIMFLLMAILGIAGLVNSETEHDLETLSSCDLHKWEEINGVLSCEVCKYTPRNEQ